MEEILKYLWLALFVLFVGIASYLAEELFFPVHMPFASNSPEAIIFSDFKELRNSKNLPIEILQVREVFFSDHRIQKTNINWEEMSKIYFPRKMNGAFELQIEAFDAPDEGKVDGNLSIFQFSLFEKMTKNKVWELSRTYRFTSKDKPAK